MRDKAFYDICEKGILQEVREALTNGADVNQRVVKRTSLMEAVHYKNEPLVSLLLQQPGIQINAKDLGGWTALHFEENKENILNTDKRKANIPPFI